MGSVEQPRHSKTNVQLTTPVSVIHYLSKTPFKSKHVDVLSGGITNFVYRAHLVTPFRGQFETVVVKHNQPYKKDLPDIAFGVERQIFEVEALKRVRAWIDESKTSDSIITVPEVYSFDTRSCVVIMEDCGSNIMTLREFLYSSTMSPVAPALAPLVGSQLGSFMAQMHHWSRSNPGGLLDFFRANEVGKDEAVWLTYGRLVETVDGSAELPRLEGPMGRFRVNEEGLKVAKEIAETMQARIKAASDTFVMGDFWPNNISLAFQPTSTGGSLEIKKMYIFDWEYAKTGVQGVELGQFCANMIQMQRFAQDPRQAAPISHLLHRFLASYASALKAVGDPAVNDTQLIRDILVHCGNHLAVLTPRAKPWENKEICRKVVSEGVELMVKAYKGEKKYFKQSFARSLL